MKQTSRLGEVMTDLFLDLKMSVGNVILGLSTKQKEKQKWQ
jgi:hypothetical protein